VDCHEGKCKLNCTSPMQCPEQSVWSEKAGREKTAAVQSVFDSRNETPHCLCMHEV
jgi:hypothetical protein